MASELDNVVLRKPAIFVVIQTVKITEMVEVDFKLVMLRVKNVVESEVVFVFLSGLVEESEDQGLESWIIAEIGDWCAHWFKFIERSLRRLIKLNVVSQELKQPSCLVERPQRCRAELLELLAVMLILLNFESLHFIQCQIQHHYVTQKSDMVELLLQILVKLHVLIPSTSKIYRSHQLHVFL